LAGTSFLQVPKHGDENPRNQKITQRVDVKRVKVLMFVPCGRKEETFS
jgi:hypothetical protein